MVKEECILGGGCFWCLESIFSMVKGVEHVECGYAGGGTNNPTYEDVCKGRTGHAEVVKIVYNEEKISFEDILSVFFAIHDPTTLNRQGNDVGTQYRSAIFYTNTYQKEVANTFIKRLENDKEFLSPIVTEVVPQSSYFPAEEYHNRFFEKNPSNAFCRYSIPPKISKLKKRFKELLSD
ncbi:peptide-methionine (S)-S-oxide reductase MsrA [Halomonas sp. LBP4]|uniref:peptide-methionine (S)-S-oxide reductase MsrA n=1 Tax=Halomonas sp. LBP4 TaxID=2044917 RepID=UPI000D75A968|nr:peptide-methionine (S)-S-oxide reductase MsrA [Halomonas sp. LBP4]PXX95469.1 peptide-methionine (S)-S-oxide reductase [Halomonas sp. LBP4]